MSFTFTEKSSKNTWKSGQWEQQIRRLQLNKLHVQSKWLEFHLLEIFQDFWSNMVFALPAFKIEESTYIYSNK